MAINREQIENIAGEIISTSGQAAALSTLTSGKATDLEVASATATLISGAFKDSPLAREALKSFGLTAGIAALAAEASDGELTWGDLSATSAVLADFFSRIPNPAAQAASKYFGVLALAPGFGEWLGKNLYHWLNPNIATDFNSAQSFVRRYDPLALDLDGDGIETTGTGNWQNTTLFDHNGDSVAEGTGWLSGDDGWLVRDINGNGAIDNGSELFGDNTVRTDGSTGSDGFSALSDLDNNNDGVIDANDAAFGELKVWRDLNQDGNTISATRSFVMAGGWHGGIDKHGMGRTKLSTKFTDTHYLERHDNLDVIEGPVSYSDGVNHNRIMLERLNAADIQASREKMSSAINDGLFESGFL